MTSHHAPESGPRRFKPYPAYKDSGVEWLGEIPVGWGIKRLKRIVQFRGGGTPTKDNVEYWRGDIPWVSPKDMKVSVVLDTEDKITAQAIRDSATKLVQAGAVLIVVRSGILVHSIPVALTGCEVTLNQDLKALIPRSELLPEYLVYLISGMQRELLVEWKKEGATVESLELELVANTPTPLPAIAEQRAIAAFLDRETAKIDALVAKKERLIELLQEKRTALITRAVTKGLDPNVPMKDSGVEWPGEIPAHWEVGRLKAMLSLSREKNGNEPVGEMLSVSGYRGVEPKEYDFEERKRSAEELAEYRVVRVGQLVVNAMWLNYAGLGVSAFEGHVSPAYRCYDIARRYERGYLHHLMRSAIYVGRYCGLLYGIRPNSLQIKNHDWDSIELLMPPRAEQRAIAAFLDRETAKIDALVAKVRDAIDRLRELRTALISAAVTGKIDVRGEAA